MAGFLRRLGVAFAVAVVLPAAALAGSLTLHPNGFGEHSYSAWKGDQGLPDSTGNQDQALYFQKMTATTTVAAGVAVFKGFEGQSTSVLGDLEFWWRTDGHCGAGAPRFNIRTQESPVAQFVGCQGMAPGATMTYEGKTFEQRTFSGLGIVPGTIVSLSLVFDEGNDVGRGFVYLDDIRAGGHTWSSASDNSNADGSSATIVQSSTPLAVLLGEPIALALGY